VSQGHVVIFQPGELGRFDIEALCLAVSTFSLLTARISERFIDKIAEFGHLFGP
jgi:hypothetical protein